MYNWTRMVEELADANKIYPMPNKICIIMAISLLLSAIFVRKKTSYSVITIFIAASLLIALSIFDWVSHLFAEPQDIINGIFFTVIFYWLLPPTNLILSITYASFVNRIFNKETINRNSAVKYALLIILLAISYWLSEIVVYVMFGNPN